MIHLGTAGGWGNEPCGQSWYSWTSNGIETAPPERVCLDKMVNGIDKTYIRDMAEKARVDTVDGRVWLLFNEPDTAAESAYGVDPWRAAANYWEAYVALKAARNDIVIGGPNCYWAGAFGEGTNEGEYNAWLGTFLDALVWNNARHAAQAKIDVLALHDYSGRYHDSTQAAIDWNTLERHIAWVRRVAAIRDCIDVDVPVWITETGILWPQSDVETRVFMDDLLGWLDGNPSGVERAYWFVSYDSWWWANVPNTNLYDPAGNLTALGQDWKAAAE